MLKHVVVIHYSQTGQLTRAAKSLVQPMQTSGCKVSWINIEPITPYPFPWSLRKFFGVFPDSVLGITPPIKPIETELIKSADLVIIASQVWFLAPSLPIQAFFNAMKSEPQNPLRGKKIITLFACRNMWLKAFQLLKNMIFDTGALLIGNVALVDKSPMWASFIMTPRWLLTGKTNQLFGLFPSPGIKENQLADVEKIGTSLINRPSLHNIGFSSVEEKLILPEWIARSIFLFWAATILKIRQLDSRFENIFLTGFVVTLVLSILFLLPLILLSRMILRPFLKPYLNKIVLNLSSTTTGVSHV